MICTTLQHKNCEQLLEALDKSKMAEIRLDRCPELSEEDIDEIFSSDLPLVATCRIAEVMQQNPQMSPVKAASFAEKLLKRAIEAGASYVDLEIEAPKEMVKRIKAVAEENGSLLIRSFHDFVGTDSHEALKAVVEKCFYHAADIVKVVTMAKTAEDLDKLMSLYDEYEEGHLIAFCMGELGKQSRLQALKAGAPFTYAAFSDDEIAAEGQWLAQQMQDAVYADAKPFNVEITVPSSKSYAQRAIIAAALADGVSRLGNYTPCGDSESAIALARSLGADVKIESAGDMLELIIKGIGATEGCLDGKLDAISVGESGLLARLSLPLMAQLSDKVTISGEGTLPGRKLSGASEILSTMGTSIVYEDSPEHLPATVSGRLSTTNAEISGANGSQLVSGLLMALPLSHKNSNLLVENPKSIPYSFMTLDILKRFGIKISNEMLGGRDFLESDGDWSLCTEMIFKLRAAQKYTPAEFCLEGDWSCAAPYLCAAAVFGDACVDGLNTTSLQADLAVMDILMAAGATVSQADGEDGEIFVKQSPLLAFTANLSHCPDLFPVVSVFAAFCQGVSRMTGLSRLANKECDRSTAIAEMLSQLGVEFSVEGDDLLVSGHSLAWRLLNGKLLKGGKYTSSHDHRMVMALKFAALAADTPIEIDDVKCVAKSAPGFVESFASAQL